MERQTEREKVFAWRESITMLPEKEFFGVIHIYLGEVKSPFNKQKLVEQLESLLRNADNQKTLLSLIDSFDAEVISLISLVPNMTFEKIRDFLGDTYTEVEISMKIENLTERLVIYKERRNEKQIFFKINPVIETILQSKISASNIFCQPVDFLKEGDSLAANDLALGKNDHENFTAGQSNFSQKNDSQSLLVPSNDFAAPPALLASFISYILEHPDLCKADGTFKKSDAARLSQIFSGRLELLQNLFTALCNLLVLDASDKKVSVNFKRLEEFAALQETERCIFLSVAAACPMSKNLLQTQASILADCLAVIPKIGFSRKNLWRAAWLSLQSQKSQGQMRPHGRFSRMIAASATENAGALDVERSVRILFDKIIDSAVIFGLLQKKSVPGAADKAAPKQGITSEAEQFKKVVTISGLSVTIVPGLDLSEYSKLTPFLSIKKYDTAVDFELSKGSVFRAFNAGYDEQMILSLLERHSNFPLPQSLSASVSDWHNSYRSAVLFKGYVLKLDEKKACVFEKNKKAFAHVLQKISAGVYLLDITNDNEAALFSFHSGFDFLANVNGAQKEGSFLPFPSINVNHRANILFDDILCVEKNVSEGTEKIDFFSDNSRAEKVKDNLHEHLESLNLEEKKASVLHSYIERKIILSPKQLEAAFVQLGVDEARGTDFFGKIHVLENALGAAEKVTVTVPDEDNEGQFISVTGIPISVTKKNGAAELLLQLDRSTAVKKFSIAQLTSIKWHKKM